MDVDLALSSFLRGVSKIRISSILENVLPQIKTAKEKKRVLRSTMALDYLQSKTVRRRLACEISVGD